jgi:hypothetical protein
LLKILKNGNSYMIDGGTAHGIAPGDEFTLYKDSELSQKSLPLGILVVREAYSHQSTMTPLSYASRLKFQKLTFALQTKAGTAQDLRVHVTRRKRLISILEEILARDTQYKRPDRPRILLVEKEHAELSIDLSRRKVVFEILDQSIRAYNLLRIPISVQPEPTILYSILDAAAHFRYHLRRTSDDVHNLQNMVHLELTEVKQVEGKYDHDLNPVIDPIGHNLNMNGVINLVPNPKVMYGITIRNESSIALYVALFYFEMNNLSISMCPAPLGDNVVLTNSLLLASLYQSDQQKPDPPLRPKGNIKLGYGTGDDAPFVYTLSKGHDVEVGFLKLFLSTEYVDFSGVPQSSPFTSVQSLEEAGTSFTSTLSGDTVMATVVLRRG